MKNIRIGIIGAGGICSGIHLPVLSRLLGGEGCSNAAFCGSIAAICDLRPARAEALAAQYSIPKTYISYHEMLAEESLDAVFALVQPDCLFRVVRDCLSAGAHVFMEKPMGITLTQAHTLADKATRAEKVLHVGFNRRYIPLVQEVLRRLREATEITHAEGRFYKNSSPAFYQGCATAFQCDVIHVTDLLCYAAGTPIAKAATLESYAPDNGEPQAWQCVLQFENGITGIIRSHYAAGGRVHDFEFHGKGASAFIDLGFGGMGCSAKLLYGSGGKQSLSAMGTGCVHIETLDGIEIAGSDRYADYYGYRDEDILFLQAAAAGSPDPVRLAQDLAAMEATAKLEAARF
ncbi:MAG: Gfo/Idh/MocA family oxidoreductase [Oscillospiraceae bacterium]|jgi:predicted dehydrogenase|nr:Gfo/Idh/MocA family oxidoreductase [Oscillospiraceae bacterium]